MTFGSVIAVDWSARSTPSSARPSKDAIWIGQTRDGVDEEPVYCRTRAQAMARLHDLVAQDRAAGRRALICFDFAFGWPQGFAQAITGTGSALALWSHLTARITDGPDNENNRYAVAGALNAALPGVGPFWAKSHREHWPEIPFTDTRRDHTLPERRQVESRTQGAKPVWQLAGAGAVGSQSLIGVTHLQRFRAQVAAQVWPFDTGGDVPDGDVVLAEIYPSLYTAEIRARREEGEILDRAQVRVVASHLAALDRGGVLHGLLDIRTLGDAVVQQEGWILGVPVEGAVPKLRNDCFALPPGVHWTPVATALERLRQGLRVGVTCEDVDLAHASGRVLAQDVVARRSNPSVANSAVDGFAFATGGVQADGPASLTLCHGRAAAGVAYSGTVPAGGALRILTGAAIPDECDTVVLQEDVVQADGQIRFEGGLRKGANVRQAGEDFAKGSVLLPAGRRVSAIDLALLAAGGVSRVCLRRKLRVAILSSGDEVIDAPAWTGASTATLPDANRPMLAGMLRSWGMEVVDLGIVGDVRGDVRAALDQGAAHADAIITTGGASAGDEDHISAVLREAQSLHTWRIAVKPGRPLAMGMWGEVPVFGLPGNPVAALVCALIFARPALMTLAGEAWPASTPLFLPAAFSKRKKAGRREYLRARLRDGRVEVYPSEGSGRIAGLSWAEGLCELPDGAMDVAPGVPVAFYTWASFGL